MNVSPIEAYGLFAIAGVAIALMIFIAVTE